MSDPHEQSSEARIKYESMLRDWLHAQIKDLVYSESQRAQDSQARRCALISVAQCEDGAIHEFVQVNKLAYERLFMQTSEAALAEIGPWLVELPAEPDVQLCSALAQHASSQALTLISSPLRLPKLCEHLRDHLFGNTFDATPVLLRYFDPRVGFDMVEHWPEDARQRFLAPLHWWRGWDGDFMPRQIKGGKAHEIAPPVGRIDLSPQWSQAMDELGRAHLAATLLAEELEETDPAAAQRLERIHPQLQRQIARDALAFSEREQLAGWNNSFAACRHALLTHARFYTHPHFLAALTLAKEDASFDLRELLADMPSELKSAWSQDHDQMLVRLYDRSAQTLADIDAQPFEARALETR